MNIVNCIYVSLKAAFHQEKLKHGIQGGRSFFLPPPPKENRYLGDFSELWLGLFQSVCLGQMPFLNVDVNHKAFPQFHRSLIELLQDFERYENEKLQNRRSNRKFFINLNRPLDPRIKYTLEQQLSGLDICYTIPGTSNTRIHKFIRVEREPAQVKFKQNNSVITVLKYFRNLGRRIQYPALPCISLGNAGNPQAVPMEFCFIPKQVKQLELFIINNRNRANLDKNIISADLQKMHGESNAKHH